MSLLLCIACGHPWIYHEEHGCTELVEIDSEDGMAFCDCTRTEQANADTTARVVRRPGDGGRKR